MKAFNRPESGLQLTKHSDSVIFAGDAMVKSLIDLSAFPVFYIIVQPGGSVVVNNTPFGNSWSPKKTEEGMFVNNTPAPGTVAGNTSEMVLHLDKCNSVAMHNSDAIISQLTIVVYQAGPVLPPALTRVPNLMPQQNTFDITQNTSHAVIATFNDNTDSGWLHVSSFQEQEFERHRWIPDFAIYSASNIPKKLAKSAEFQEKLYIARMEKIGNAGK